MILRLFERSAITKELVKIVVQSLVDYPEEVEVQVITGGRTSVLELSVAREDLGKVVGRQGHTAHAIRTILNSVSGKARRNVVLEIVD